MTDTLPGPRERDYALTAQQLITRNREGGWTGRHAIAAGLVYALLELARGLHRLVDVLERGET